MIDKLKIKQKITSIPIIAGLTFFLIIVILVILNNYNKSISNKIQSHYYPLLELNQKFEDNFAKLQRSLQDAVTTADSAELEKSEFIYNSLFANMKNAANHYKDEIIDFELLSKNLEDYYGIAKKVSNRMINEATDEDLVNDLEMMTEKYNGMKKSFEDNVNFYQTKISSEFESLNNNNSLYVIIIATLLAAVLIGSISQILIKSITDPLNDIVNLAYEVGGGNFDVEVSRATNDEFGVLKEAFREMIVKVKNLLKEKDHALKNLKSEFIVRKKAEKELKNHKDQSGRFGKRKNTGIGICQYQSAKRS